MEKYQSMVFAQCRKSSASTEEAEDLTQDIFLKAFESLSSFRGEASFSTWLYRITQNHIQGKIRKKNAKLEIVETFHEETTMEKIRKWKDQITPEVLLLKDEYKSKLASMLSKLPASYSIPLKMYYFENMSYKEISDQLDIKINTLKSYIFRAKESLKKSLESYEKS
jgi:RNA polymerase sigma-70 factor, ECF subfamily